MAGFDQCHPIKDPKERVTVENEVFNELEFVDGKIYANVWLQDRIAIIQPGTGQVSGSIDLAELKSRMPPLPIEPLRPVMNGIAYDAMGRRLFVSLSEFFGVDPSTLVGMICLPR
jgi:glutamine cyclotransferase